MSDGSQDIKRSLAVRVSCIANEIGTLDRDGKNKVLNYRFISDSQVIEKVREKANEHGVSFRVSMPDMPVITNLAKGVHALIKLHLVILSTDNPEDQINSVWWGEGYDTLDKAVQKAATSALKFLLIKTFFISGSEDPEGIPHSAPANTGYNTNRNYTQPTQQEQSPPAGPPVKDRVSYLQKLKESINSSKSINYEKSLEWWEDAYTKGKIEKLDYTDGLALLESVMDTDKTATKSASIFSQEGKLVPKEKEDKQESI